MSLIYVLAVPSDDFTKKEIKDIYNEVYDNDSFTIEYHSIADYIGYVVFEIIESYGDGEASLKELNNLKEKALESIDKSALRAFFEKVNKPYLFDEIDGVLYVSKDDSNSDFYGMLAT